MALVRSPLVVRANLFIGTDEQTAKLAPTKGLVPPIFLTDVYPGFFCSGKKWGIISLCIDDLYQDMLAPFSFYIKGKDVFKYKNKWKKSLSDCGVCTYLANILPNQIERVTIFDPAQNPFVVNLIKNQPNPEIIKVSEHKAAYNKNIGLTRWLNAETIAVEDIYNGQTNYKLLCQVSDKIMDRSGLDIFHISSKKNVG